MMLYFHALLFMLSILFANGQSVGTVSVAGQSFANLHDALDTIAMNPIPAGTVSLSDGEFILPSNATWSIPCGWMLEGQTQSLITSESENSTLLVAGCLTNSVTFSSLFFNNVDIVIKNVDFVQFRDVTANETRIDISYSNKFEMERYQAFGSALVTHQVNSSIVVNSTFSGAGVLLDRFPSLSAWNANECGHIETDEIQCLDNVGEYGPFLWEFVTSGSIQNSLFARNSAISGSGGAVYFQGNRDLSSSLVVFNTSFQNNYCAYSGGGLFVFMGIVAVNASSFLGNVAEGAGGGLRVITNTDHIEQSLPWKYDAFIIQSLFQNNAAGMGGAMFFSAVDSPPVNLILIEPIIKVKNCSFHLNICDQNNLYASTIIFNLYGVFELEDSKFLDSDPDNLFITATTRGRPDEITLNNTESRLYVRNCIFSNIKMSGGRSSVIFFDGFDEVTISNCSFNNCSVPISTKAIIIIRSSFVFLESITLFQNEDNLIEVFGNQYVSAILFEVNSHMMNQVNEDGIVFLFYNNRDLLLSNWTIQNVQSTSKSEFIRTQGTVGGTIIENFIATDVKVGDRLFLANSGGFLIINNAIFRNVNAFSGSGRIISVSAYENAHIRQVVMEQVSVATGILAFVSANLTLRDVSVSNFMGKNPLYMMGGSVRLYNIAIEDSELAGSSGEIGNYIYGENLFASRLVVRNTKNIKGDAFKLGASVTLSIEQSLFEDCASLAALGVGFDNPSTISSTTTIVNSIFRSNKVEYAALKYLIGAKLVLNNVTFENNSRALQCFVTNGNITTSDCLFQGNYAQEQGGAINMLNECRIDAKSSIFVNNSALISGGAINFADGRSFGSFSDCLFQNNSAPLGGAISISQSSTSLVSFSNTTFADGVQNIPSSSIFYEFEGDRIETGTEIVSHLARCVDDGCTVISEKSSFPVSTSLTHLDVNWLQNDQNFASGSSLQFEISLVDAFGQHLMYKKQHTVAVSIEPILSNISICNGSTAVISSKNQVILSKSRELFSFSVVGEFGCSYNIVFDHDDLFARNDHVEVQLADRCPIGSVVTPYGSFNLSQCSACQEQTFALAGDESCRKCPVGLVCRGGDNIVPESGWWTTKSLLPGTFQCFTAGCQGNALGDGGCRFPFQGTLCGNCQDPFVLDSTINECVECSSVEINALLVFLAILAVVIYVAVKVFLKVKPKITTGEVELQTMSADKIPPSSSAPTTAGSSFLFNLLVEFLQRLSIISSYLFTGIAALGSFGSVADASTGTLLLSPFTCILQWSYWQRYLFLLLAPVVLVIVLGSIVRCVRCCTVRMPVLKWADLTFLVFVLFQPRLVSESLTMLRCVNVGNESLFRGDPSVICFSGTHSVFSGIAIVVLVIVLLFIPFTLMFASVLKKWVTLELLTEGLAYNRRWWLPVNLSLKGLLGFGALVPDPSYRVTFVSTVIVGELSLHILFSPYNSSRLNVLYRLTLLIILFNLVSVTPFISSTHVPIYISEDLNQSLKQGFSWSSVTIDAVWCICLIAIMIHIVWSARTGRISNSFEKGLVESDQTSDKEVKLNSISAVPSDNSNLGAPTALPSSAARDKPSLVSHPRSRSHSRSLVHRPASPRSQARSNRSRSASRSTDQRRSRSASRSKTSKVALSAATQFLTVPSQQSPPPQSNGLPVAVQISSPTTLNEPPIMESGHQE